MSKALERHQLDKVQVHAAGRAGPLEYHRKVWLRLWMMATFVFLYAPIILLVIFSFNDSKRNIVWQGFTLKYYGKAIANASLIEAFTNSLVIAIIATVISTILGALTALALWRFRFPGKAATEGAMALPIVIPEICMGVALMAFFIRSALANRPTLAAIPVCDHHRPCRLLLSLRCDRGARASCRL